MISSDVACRLTVRAWFRGMRHGDEAIALSAQLDALLSHWPVASIEYQQTIAVFDQAEYDRLARMPARWRYIQSIVE